MPQKNHKPKKIFSQFLSGTFWGLGALLVLAGIYLGRLDHLHRGRIYPHVFVLDTQVSGLDPQQLEQFWTNKNQKFADQHFEFRSDQLVATVSGQEMGLGYDSKLIATQAFLVGRSGLFLADLNAKLLQPAVKITPYLRYERQILVDALTGLATRIDSPAADALFQFTDGKVSSFRPSRSGQRLNIDKTLANFDKLLTDLPDGEKATVSLPVVIETLAPKVTTDQVNDFGIRELIGTGYSEFAGSIPGRIHNVALAAGRLNGVLIGPGETFSFNQIVGDISAATGYQSAYIIKDGRTVLGDGGGVCQVSSTMFRAALNAGLQIVERHPHAYRVHYYEEGGVKPGLDATVFSPSVDLKIKNTTGTHILIQTKTDTKNLTLTFDLYGTNDGRRAEIIDHLVWAQTPPPPPLYQDDPTLPKGVIKQVDWSAWGAKTSFKYKVTRNGEILEDTKFISNFRPWQAVYLRGTL